jgi:hypothetical protein
MYRVTYVNADNPQLRLLAEFLRVMAEANEEATRRVLNGLRICVREDVIYVENRYGQMDVAVTFADEVAGPSPTDDERCEMLLEIYDRVKEST